MPFDCRGHFRIIGMSETLLKRTFETVAIYIMFDKAYSSSQALVRVEKLTYLSF